MEVLGESQAGGDTQPDSETEKAKASSDDALLAALRGFVRRAGNQPEEKTEDQEKISGFQAVVLLVFVLDAVLLYPEFQSWFENPLFKFALKMAPWLLGATAFAYSEKARAWLLTQCRRPWLAVLAVLLLVPLVVLRQPIFSVKVRVGADGISPGCEDNRVALRQLEDRLFLLTLPDLAKPYKISITDHHNDKFSRPSSITLGRFRVARATIAQIPVVGKLFGSPELSLAPLYRVYTVSNKDGYIDVEGVFQEGFFQQDSLTGSSCSPIQSNKREQRAVRCNIGEGTDALMLPRGWYDLTLFREGCKKLLTHWEVKAGENETIDLNKLCPS